MSLSERIYYLEVLKPVSVGIPWNHNITRVDNTPSIDTSLKYKWDVGEIVTIKVITDKVSLFRCFIGDIEFDSLKEFVVDRGSPRRRVLNVMECLEEGYLIDITTQLEREEKLKELGI
jgi:hypothetical protein